MDIGNLPTRLALALMQRRNIAIFSLLLVLLVNGACHTHRQTVETIALSQRHEQQSLQFYDTTRKSVHMLLDGIVTQYYSNMKDLFNHDSALCVRAVIRAELTMDEQTKTETTILTEAKDTLSIKQLKKNEKLFHGSDAIKKSLSFPIFWAVIACIVVFVLIFLLIKLRDHYY